MIDLTGDSRGRTQARLLDLVPGRSKKSYADWLTDRGPAFRAAVADAALDPSGGYKSAIGAELADARAVLDALHVVKLGTQVVDEVRRRVHQNTTGHRGRKGDPLLGIQTWRRGREPHRPPGRSPRTRDRRGRCARGGHRCLTMRPRPSSRIPGKAHHRPARPRREAPRFVPDLPDP